MIKLSDYVIEFLVQKGINDIFLVSGGGIMHLVDSVGRNPLMRYYCNHHEQACAISAEAYARVKNGIGACLVTTGPGGANALSGIVGAWVDSIPVIVLSGQVRRDLIADYHMVRQLGPQEGNIVGMAQAVTKYAKTVLEPRKIKEELELAFFEATHGRPGPVWLEIPLDVQDSNVEEDELEGYKPQASRGGRRREELERKVEEVIEMIKSSERPLFICGNGIHLSKSEPLLKELMERLTIPVVLPYTAKDLVPEIHPLNVGIFGTSGQRRANFAVQNSDCLVILAAGLNCSKVGFKYKEFAPKAKKIMVDIDEGQLFHQLIKPDIAVQSDIREFILELLHQIEHLTFEPHGKWLQTCENWKRRYTLILNKYYDDPEHVNSYVFMDKLSDLASNNDVLLTGNGLDCVSYWQSFRVKEGQRTMLNGNWGSMGWDLPAAIGACIGNNRKRTICITGDGSLQFNIQELMTIRYYDLPIKIFIFNNHGYSAIRATQKTFFEGRFVGADLESGVSNPDFSKLAESYGFEYEYVKNNDMVEKGIRQTFSVEGPAICEVNISPEQWITPKASAYRREDGTMESRPLEDMFPFLSREELWENMHLFDRDDK